jgi:hypothetical protein
MVANASKKMIRILVGLAIGTNLLSCGPDKSTIDYNEPMDTTSVIDDRIKDSTKILVSELPVKFDSTDILLFAIGLVDFQERGGYSKIGSYSNSDLSLGYRESDVLTGNFINIVFQDKQGSERKLTDRKIKIRNVTFLRDVFKNTKREYLLYSISDRDSNGDKELDQSDLEALYVSKMDGTEFKKLTKELHEFYDWSLIRGENRVYFRTLEDKNKDGDLNNTDKFHYYFIDFSGDKYVVLEYDPVKVFQ